MNNSSGTEHPNGGAHERRITLSLEPAVARRQLAVELTDRQWEGDVGDVLLALNEALVNARQHAGGARRAEASLLGSSLVIEVWDRGRGFDPTSYMGDPPDVLAEHGRGVWLMSRVADGCEIDHDASGGRLVLRFDRGGQRGGSHSRRASRPAGARAPENLLC